MYYNTSTTTEHLNSRNTDARLGQMHIFTMPTIKVSKTSKTRYKAKLSSRILTDMNLYATSIKILN